MHEEHSQHHGFTQTKIFEFTSSTLSSETITVTWLGSLETEGNPPADWSQNLTWAAALQSPSGGLIANNITASGQSYDRINVNDGETSQSTATTTIKSGYFGHGYTYGATINGVFIPLQDLDNGISLIQSPDPEPVATYNVVENTYDEPMILAAWDPVSESWTWDLIASGARIGMPADFEDMTWYKPEDFYIGWADGNDNLTVDGGELYGFQPHLSTPHAFADVEIYDADGTLLSSDGIEIADTKDPIPTSHYDTNPSVTDVTHAREEVIDGITYLKNQYNEYISYTDPVTGTYYTIIPQSERPNDSGIVVQSFDFQGNNSEIRHASERARQDAQNILAELRNNRHQAHADHGQAANQRGSMISLLGDIEYNTTQANGHLDGILDELEKINEGEGEAAVIAADPELGEIPDSEFDGAATQQKVEGLLANAKDLVPSFDPTLPTVSGRKYQYDMALTYKGTSIDFGFDLTPYSTWIEALRSLQMAVLLLGGFIAFVAEVRAAFAN